MNPYSLYIGPAGPFSIFPSSRLKRRPSHCELELAEGEYGFVSAWGPHLSHTFPQEEVLPVHTDRQTQNSPHRFSTHVTLVQNHSPTASPTQSVSQQAKKSPGKHSMAQGPQNDSSTQMHSHPGSSHITTTMQETSTGPQPHRRQPHNHSHA